MAIADTIAVVIHLSFAGLWTGSVIYFGVGVVPIAREGSINAAPLASLTDRLTLLSRASAALLFLSGGHIAAQRYTVERLTGDPNGHLVLTMIALWFALAALVEIGAKRLTAGTERKKVREPARRARPLFLAAAVVAVGLLLTAGLLTT